MRFPKSARILPLGLLAAGSVHGAERVAVADTWVHGAANYTSHNYGGGDFMKVRSRSSRIALIQFDTSGLPAGAGSGATLSLHVSRVLEPGIVHIRPVVSAWSEDDVTFATRPMIGSEIVGTLHVAPESAGQRVGVDVSSLVESWLANPASNHGLALTAADSATDVYFGTRDVGTAPELIIAVANAVTVSRHGGNYSDPITAAQQAFSGDTWCVNPTQDTPCMMSIDEGIYLLAETFVVPENVAVVGAGQTTTLLVAEPGVEIAVEAGSPIENLAIVNRQDASVTRAVGLRAARASLTSVAIRTEGAVENVGMDLADSADWVLIVETDITAAGGQNAFAIDMNTGSGALDIQRSRIAAIGAVMENQGITKNFDEGGSVVATDTDIIATGGRSASGIGISDEEGSSITVIGGSVTASASETAFGIGGGEYSEDLWIEGARVVVDAPSRALGIHWYGVQNVGINLTNVLVDSSDVALSTYMESELGNSLVIETSQLVGTRRALDIGHESSSLSVSIDLSLLKGEESLRTAGTHDAIDIADSILDGIVGLQTATVSCEDVLGSDYGPLGGDCLPPVASE